MDLVERIDRWGNLAPDRLAHISGNRQMTYGELVRASDALAAYLARSLPRDHSPVAVIGNQEPEMIVAQLGAIKAGHPYLLVDSSIPAQEAKQFLEAARAALVLEPAQVAALTAGPPPVGIPSPAWRPGPGDPWAVLLPSGSGAEEPYVEISCASLSSLIDETLSEHLLAESGETFLNQAPFSNHLSLFDLYLSLVSGGTLFSLQRDEEDDPGQLANLLGRSEVSVWVSTPGFAQMCLGLAGFAAGMLPRARLFLLYGETLPPGLVSGLQERYPMAEVWYKGGLA